MNNSEEASGRFFCCCCCCFKTTGTFSDSSCAVVLKATAAASLQSTSSGDLLFSKSLKPPTNEQQSANEPVDTHSHCAGRHYSKPLNFKCRSSSSQRYKIKRTNLESGVKCAGGRLSFPVSNILCSLKQHLVTFLP